MAHQRGGPARFASKGRDHRGWRPAGMLMPAARVSVANTHRSTHPLLEEFLDQFLQGRQHPRRGVKGNPPLSAVGVAASPHRLRAWAAHEGVKAGGRSRLPAAR